MSVSNCSGRPASEWCDLRLVEDLGHERNRHLLGQERLGPLEALTYSLAAQALLVNVYLLK